uniref:Calmodulin n=1 Tax=Leptocylindrus danicus TaxID=163516 RepID=A0A7S2L6I5_9STRA|mmetsp:Transcript_32568/g.47162  ORF Transcript_32568/g.47162 Transcript_32568/m.47162 type:complete len:599 (+) Transcript_32568:2039-3835(+)|eukprot:CAMPEP_0116022094 /NCGR_PEP_ID=MMETSP0321-20121206/10782_1 /TAXON_ID=163516 /ORGANISM="Leptocylindrus danicus var. danicus, Strain B650" /LENGTH=598 /DNA_ID=CAMNT_0003493099 /DNA_START=2003 /DNA_END=3799 /DNA_ORIENTATION=+
MKRKKVVTSAREERQRYEDNIGAVKALQKLDEYISRSKTSIILLFKRLDSSHDGALENEEIIRGFMKLTDISMTLGQAEALVEFIDFSGDGVIQIDELDKCLRDFRKAKREGGLQQVIDNATESRVDRVFPNWLVAREDFRLIFTRFAEDDDSDCNKEQLKVQRLFGVEQEKRSREDMQVLALWMQRNSVLPGLSYKRYLDLSKYINFLEAEPGHSLCAQGEIGDAFYILFAGEVQVLVDGQLAHTLVAGEGFGERSLETDEPRNATCICSQTSRLLVVKAKDYKSMLKQHQTKKFNFAMDYLQHRCEVIRDWPYTKVYHLSGSLVRRQFESGEVLFRSGDESVALYFLISGEATAQKSIRRKATNRWPDRNSQYAVLEHERTIAIELKKFSDGDIFGEDLIFGFGNRQYCVVAKEPVDCFLLNRNDAIKYFYREKDKLRNRAQGLYISSKELKLRYEEKARQKKVYDNIKRQAFGERYTERSRRANCRVLKRKHPTDNCNDRSKIQLPSIPRRSTNGFDIIISRYSEGIFMNPQEGEDIRLFPSIRSRAVDSEQKENMNSRQTNIRQCDDSKSNELTARLMARRNTSKLPSINRAAV